MTHDLLAIYLQDHHAGSCLGVDLVRRAASNNGDNAFGDELWRLATDIEQDQKSLEQIMRELNVRPDVLKDSGARLGERLGRLKMNGRFTRYSPLSRLLELEGLMLAIAGKEALWQSLVCVLAIDHPLRQRVDWLLERARDQRNRVERLRIQAAEVAFEQEQRRPEEVVPTAFT